ncbi:AraC family ligand binding domain-containing protein [Myxococcus sp. K38C18041901]|uniref:AraC family ligand binding domain-containing protein n=1 Tax=Myxococcus guangdongensis TaxID=2906760 RepID=UPI0020A7B9B2|nr:AraC family ligand binding domain-containing protein [Myxococcus guangdongensis]MCP3060934.1 AraC family ligand binding domain-containing protein [Myxococcus guangdongensis]
MVTEWDGHATAQVWRPGTYPGLVLYRVSGRATTQALHVHDELQLTLDVGHVQQVCCGGVRLMAPPGSLVVIPPGEVHALHAESGRPGVLCGMLVPVALLRPPSRPAREEEGPPIVDDLFPGGGAVLADPDVARDFVALHRALRGLAAESGAHLWPLLSRLLARLRQGRGGLSATWGGGHRASP